MIKTALMIIDVQVAMFSYENMDLYRGEDVLNNICVLLEEARLNKVPIVFIQHTTDEEYKRGTTTWQLHSRIKPLAGEIVVEKTTCDAFYKTNLEAVLKDLEVNALIIVGMQTEFCVDTTCRSAFSHGFENVLIKDAHSTFDSRVLKGEQIVEHHNNIIGGRFAKLKNTVEGINILKNLL